MGAKTRRRFANEPDRYYDSPPGFTGRKRFRLAPLEDEEEGYYGGDKMVFCEGISMHRYCPDQREMEEDEERRPRHKKRKLHQTANEREKGAAVDCPDEADMKHLLIWLHANDVEACGPIPELVELNRKSEGRIVSGCKTLEEICTPLICEFDSVYADIYYDVNVERLYNLESSLHDEIVTSQPEIKSERPLSPVPELVELNREADGRGIEYHYNTLEEIRTPPYGKFDLVYADHLRADVDAIFQEWLCNLASPLEDETVTPQPESTSERPLSSMKSGQI